MKKVLILGAGMVVKPIVSHLLKQGLQLTVASRTKSKAEAVIDNHPNGTALALLADDEQTLDKLIAGHDITVSLLPYMYHPMVATYCIKHKKNMVTSSYVNEEMKALDKDAKDAGIIILNELGLDPGIDHMSAMRIIDHIHDKNGKVEEFYSLCGALPAPEVVDNPFKYKFSWSPKGVVMASNNDGKYLRHGKTHEITTENLFKNPLSLDFPEVGKLEIYPNRDSMPYIDLYKIPETTTMFRGTFRYPGWCESIDVMKELKLITNDKLDVNGKTYSDFMAMLINESDSSDIKQKTADYLKIDVNSYALNAIEWLGLFNETPMNRTTDTSFEITSDLMIDKMILGQEERDMVVLHHIFLASYPDGSKEVIKSSMLDFGTLSTHTSIARTTALPAAIGVEMILQNKISAKGVHIPVIPEIYNPILNDLEKLGIKMIEEYGLPLTENLQ